MGKILIEPQRMKKFVRSADSEMDYMIYQREFSGRLTPARYKQLDRYCRRNSFRPGRCGHQWDCCGCLVSQFMSFTYNHNQVVVTLVRIFNY